jgi:hypothetical protein
MITKSANKSDVSGNSQSTFMTGDRRKSLLIEYEELSRERNGINPKLSTYQRITEKMAHISAQLSEYEDPEEYASTLRKKRNKKRRVNVLRRQALSKV